MKSIAPGIVLIALILIIDLYTFKGLRLLTRGLRYNWLRFAIHTMYWLVTAASIGATIWLSASITEIQDTREYQVFFTLAGLVMLVIIPKLLFILFHLFEDLVHLGKRLFGKKPPIGSSDENGISRSKFITQVGLGMAAIPFSGMIYGMLHGRFDFRITEQSIAFPNLPDAFDGLRIVQISDAHLGSFYQNFKAVLPGFDMVNKLRPDLIFFTGDMVNNYADECDGWESYFSKLEARYGKYAILGNHDYGDYVPWKSEEAKKENLKTLVRNIEKMGFKMLLNQNEQIRIGSDAIDLIGVENWGSGRFAKYGDLDQAMRNANLNFKILLSHDPSHWDEQVREKTNIDLTLSGHTHGMQFGIEVPGIKWSPAQYRYPRWGGLYREKNQYLHVNRGFGYIGFPGRVGIPPEITLIELRKA